MKIYCDRLPRLAARYSKIGMAVLITLSAAALAGCGGGGGGSSSGGGGGSSSSLEIFSGTVTNSTSNVAAAGYTVRFNFTSVTATTTSTGAFELLVPKGDITGDDVLYVLDQSNTVQTTSSPLTNDANGVTNIAVTIGPPPPGGVPLFRKQ